MDGEGAEKNVAGDGARENQAVGGGMKEGATHGPLTLGIVSYQPVGEAMAGPAIRCLELARALSGDARVTLFAPSGSYLGRTEGFELRTYEPDGLEDALSACDAVLLQGFTLDRHPDLAAISDRFLIIDLYVPLVFEALVHYGHRDPAEQEKLLGHILMATADRLEAGDFFICASERQRDFWLGWLAAAGRVTPEAFQSDPELRGLIDVVPFGLPEAPPRAAGGKVLKGVHPAVGESDRVLLWGGGIYNWLDPFTPIRAVGRLAGRRPEIKLFFLGARHPDPNVPEMKVYDEAVALARELGIEGKNVIFNDQWVPYRERAGYLLESDLGVSANLPHVETRFSFRTRILDCIWAGLPVVATGGDSLSSLVAGRGLGLVTPSGDVDAYAAAIERLLDDRELAARCRENLAASAQGFRWTEAAGSIKRVLGGLQPGGAGPKNRRLGGGELWQMVREKEDHIEKLWDMIREKEKHINNFRQMVAEKDGLIEDFQKIIAARDRRIEELLPENHSEEDSRIRRCARGARRAVRGLRDRVRRR